MFRRKNRNMYLILLKKGVFDGFFFLQITSFKSNFKAKKNGTYKKWLAHEYNIRLSLLYCRFPKETIPKKYDFSLICTILRVNFRIWSLVRCMIGIQCVSQQNVINIVRSEKSRSTIYILLKNYVTTRVGLKKFGQRGTNFFFRKEGFSQKRPRLRFWNLHQWIPHKKLYQNQLSPEGLSFFPSTNFCKGCQASNQIQSKNKAMTIASWFWRAHLSTDVLGIITLWVEFGQFFQTEDFLTYTIVRPFFFSSGTSKWSKDKMPKSPISYLLESMSSDDKDVWGFKIGFLKGLQKALNGWETAQYVWYRTTLIYVKTVTPRFSEWQFVECWLSNIFGFTADWATLLSKLFFWVA